MEVADIVQIATILASLATVGTTFLAGFALRQAKQIFKEQQRMAQEIHQEQQKSAKQRQELTEKIHQEQIKFSQRQLFVPIFSQLKGLATIDHEKSNDYEIVNMINFLDLLGISYEGQLADRKILLRVFREFIIEQYQAIELCTDILENHTKSGKDMLLESRSATFLYERLIDENNKRDLPRDIIKE